jgi:hypothetical protein
MYLAMHLAMHLGPPIEAQEAGTNPPKSRAKAT